MATLEQLKDELIAKIKGSEDETLLTIVDDLFRDTNSEQITFTKAQLDMLALSEYDIKTNNLISEEELDQLDNQWQK